MLGAVLLVGLAQRIGIPYPILLILGGMGISFIPGLTTIDIDPKNLLIIVLPPILFYASYSIPMREFWRYRYEIIYLAIVLVIVTTLIIGLLFKWFFPSIPWALAFAFGAIVSPPDAVAATAILRRFSISSRIQTILEGESLINDASGLVLYKIAVVALLTGTFSLGSASVELLKAAIGGVAIGIASGYLLNYISLYFLNPVLSVVFTFVMPYFTFIIADELEVSAVLAVVACGLVGARLLMTHYTSLTRILGWASWDIAYILLNCFVFILIGMDLKEVTKEMSWQQIDLYFIYGLIFTIAMIVIRFFWIYVVRGIWHMRNRNDQKKLKQSYNYLKQSVVVGWSGMRGIVSLTAALALPYTHLDGTPVHGRQLVIFLTFVVIFLTLIIPGLTLPYIIRVLKLRSSYKGPTANEVRKILAVTAEKSIEKEYIHKNLTDEEHEFLLKYFHIRHHVLQKTSTSDGKKLEHLRRTIVQHQRNHLIQLWRENIIDDNLLNQLERELDLEEVQVIRGEL